MTFRNVARRYLGWCPGFNHLLDNTTTTFKLDYKAVAITTAGFLMALVAISLLAGPQLPISPGGPLQIYLNNGPGKGVYPDSGFNDTFDYSTFFTNSGWGPIFFEPINVNEFADGSGWGDVKVSDYQFAIIEEVIDCTNSLDMPNSLRECVRWLISQNFNSTYKKVYGKPPLDRIGLSVFGSNLGDYTQSSRMGYSNYYLERDALNGGFSTNEDYRRQLVLNDGVSLVKYSGSSHGVMVWYLAIDGCSESPFNNGLGYRVRIVHYPSGLIG